MIKINEVSREVTIDGEVIELLHLDFDLLVFLAKHQNEVFSRQDLLESGIWFDKFRTTRVVDQAMMRLRKKIGNDSIKTVLKKGYRLVREDIEFDPPLIREKTYTESELIQKIYDCLGFFANKHNIIVDGKDFDKWTNKFVINAD